MFCSNVRVNMGGRSIDLLKQQIDYQYFKQQTIDDGLMMCIS